MASIQEEIWAAGVGALSWETLTHHPEKCRAPCKPCRSSTAASTVIFIESGSLQTIKKWELCWPPCCMVGEDVVRFGPWAGEGQGGHDHLSAGEKALGLFWFASNLVTAARNSRGFRGREQCGSMDVKCPSTPGHKLDHKYLEEGTRSMQHHTTFLCPPGCLVLPSSLIHF